MLMTNKERQEVEMEAFKETLEEQRAHIQILDSALSNAHTNVQRLEEECRLKEGYAERVKQMTRSLDQLQKGNFSFGTWLKTHTVVWPVDTPSFIFNMFQEEKTQLTKRNE